MKALILRLNDIKILRFIISGGTATVADLAFLYIFTDLFHIWYVASAAMAFVIAFTISFIAQKFWTFNDHSLDTIRAQGSMYFLVALISLLVNTYAVYSLVDYLHFYYILAQIVVSAFIAVVNYIVYSKFIFRA